MLTFAYIIAKCAILIIFTIFVKKKIYKPLNKNTIIARHNFGTDQITQFFTSLASFF